MKSYFTAIVAVHLTFLTYPLFADFVSCTSVSSTGSTLTCTATTSDCSPGQIKVKNFTPAGYALCCLDVEATCYKNSMNSVCREWSTTSGVLIGSFFGTSFTSSTSPKYKCAP